MTDDPLSRVIPFVYVTRLPFQRIISVPVNAETFVSCEILTSDRDSSDSPLDITERVSDFIPRSIQALLERKFQRSDAGTSISHDDCVNRFQLINESVVLPVGVRYSLKENA